MDAEVDHITMSAVQINLLKPGHKTATGQFLKILSAVSQDIRQNLRKEDWA
jgi:hypothetical protein